MKEKGKRNKARSRTTFFMIQRVLSSTVVMCSLSPYVTEVERAVGATSAGAAGPAVGGPRGLAPSPASPSTTPSTTPVVIAHPTTGVLSSSTTLPLSATISVPSALVAGFDKSVLQVSTNNYIIYLNREFNDFFNFSLTL